MNCLKCFSDPLGSEQDLWTFFSYNNFQTGKHSIITDFFVGVNDMDVVHPHSFLKASIAQPIVFFD